MTIPRPEYPRPSWKRQEWLNLNGEWEFAIDGDCRMSAEKVRFDRRITVPFCPESSLSGIGETGFMECVWYRRTVQVPGEWRGRKLLLHFQAIDYDAEIYVDGRLVKRHRGCFTPVTAEVGPVEAESFEVIVRAQGLRDRNRVRGKQSNRLENYLCCYTRTTGIWQTVWMEPVPEVWMKRAKVLPVPDGFLVTVPLSANRRGWSVRARIGHDGEWFGEATVSASAGLAPVLHLTLPEKHRRFWEPEAPYLYDIWLELQDGEGHCADAAVTYGGWRFVTIDGMKLLLNGRPVFQRLVLDQGYYPDGIWTAPSDEALVRDIVLSMQAGFNGARLHQKVFEERFLYHADRMGYLVWGEFGDWGFDWIRESQPEAPLYQPGISPVAQFLEAIERDYSHPSIIGWCALNETHRRQVGDVFTLDVVDDLTQAMFHAAKAADQSRPVLDASGYIHRLPESDIYDTHDYGMPDEIAAHLAAIKPGDACDPNAERECNVPWRGQPFFISELGGIAWPPPPEGSFSYGEPPQTEEDFLERFGAILRAVKADRRVFGYCYTQLTDICQERNGLYFFDRSTKIPVEKLAACQAGPAAYETEN